MMKKRIFSMLLAMSMAATSFQGLGITARATEITESVDQDVELAEEAATGYASFTEDTLIADLSFGSDVTTGTIYSAEKGYGFSTVDYNEAAKGWVSSVYYPREAKRTEADASNVAEAKDSLAITSKVWTETESSGYGVYTYENTSTFDYDLENADYKVEVTLVNPTENAYTAYLEAEDITKVTDINVASNGTETKDFIACVTDGQLNLKFLGASAAKKIDDAKDNQVFVSKVKITRLATGEAGVKPTIYLASDSTVQTYESVYKPQTGWGQVFNQFFGDFVEEREAENCTFYQSQVYESTNAIVENRAIGGRSSKSYIEEGKLDDILEDIKPGDYLFVQWGHNDATAVRPNRYVSSQDFAKWIQVYIDGAKQRGATPVLVTPCARYSTNSDGTFKSDFAAYGNVMKQVAAENKIPLVDLTTRSIDLCNSFGVAGSESLFLHVAAGEYEGNYSKGVTDNTHLQYYGAYKFAQCVASGVSVLGDNNADLDDESKAAMERLASLVTVNLPTAVPSKLTGLKAEADSTFSITLSWDKNADSEFYYVYRAELAAGQKAEDVDFSTAKRYAMTVNTTFTDAAVVSGVTYVYVVAGYNALGVGDFSDKAAAATKAVDYAFDFNYSSSTMTGFVGISHDNKYDATKGYGFIVSPGNGRNRSNNGNAQSSPMMDDFALGVMNFAVDLPNGDYEVNIFTGDLLAGTSTNCVFKLEDEVLPSTHTSSSVEVITKKVRVADGQLNVSSDAAAYLNGITITTIALAPSGLIAKEATVNGDNYEFLLSYNGIKNAAGYKVYVKDTLSDSDFKLYKEYTKEEYEKDELGCNSMAVKVARNYEIYVVAYLEDGSLSAPSNTLKLESIIEGPKAAAPQNLRTVGLDEASESFLSELTIKWDEVKEDKYPVLRYLVYRKAPEDTEFVKIGITEETSFTDEDVNTVYAYQYKVCAYTATGEGEFSDIFTSPKVGKYLAVNKEKYTDRALVAVSLAGSDGASTSLTATDKNGNKLTEGVYLSWRSFEEDFDKAGKLATTFTVFCNGKEIAKNLKVTNLVYEGGKSSDVYKVVGSNDASVHGGLKAVETKTWANKYQELSLFAPDAMKLPNGGTVTYTSNDLSVGDIDGDGVLELIVKWYPSNAKDNSQGGYTGNTYLDSYKVDWATGEASLLSRIDLGINIRSGAHYVQYQVWDYDGDGKAEVAVKTADGTTSYVSADGTDKSLTEVSHVGAASASELRTDIINEKYDYRNTSGKILDGPEYFSVFNLEDGSKAAEDVEYTPVRGGNGSSWGDTSGNRGDRFLACTAYLNGETPFAVFARGYYARTALTAYYLADTDADGIGDTIEIYWAFDTSKDGSQYTSQGNHQVSVNDVDGDGKDEIIYGAMVIDDNGSVLYNTKLGHGDALHVSDWVDWNDGLEIFKVGEEIGTTYQVEMLDAKTGKVLAGYFVGQDTGRGVAADIDPTSKGAEFWATAGPNKTGDYKNAWNSTDGNVYSTQSTTENLIELSHRSAPSSNFSIFWDGDLLSEIQDHTFDETPYVPIGVNLYKWNYETNQQETIFYSEEIFSNNGTKGNMGLVADVLGDWREEILARSSTDNNKLRIYTTTIETDYVVPCLLEDLAYREGVAWQNTGYNQPANTSYLLSKGLETSVVSEVVKTEESVTIQWTKGCDGTLFGHEIEGYEIYKKDLETEEDYKLIASVGADVQELVDEDFDINGQYGYKVAAVVAGRTSFMSKPLLVYTDMVESVTPFDDIVVFVGSENVVLPEQVEVNYKSGKKELEAITWNEKLVKSINVKKPNTLTLTGLTESGLKVSVNIIVTETVGGVVAKFDFGIASGNVETGWTGVTVNKKKGKTKAKDLGIAYTKEKGYGFLDGSATIEGRAESYKPGHDEISAKVYGDFALPDGQTFVVDLVNGKYIVDIYSGSSYKSSVSATVEGVQFTGGNAAADFVKISDTVEVTDGQLTIDFASGITHRIDAIVVTNVVELPTDNHELKHVDGIAATCTTEGQLEYYYCEDCGSIYLDEAGENEVIFAELTVPVKGHTADTPVKENVVESTCKTEGSYELVEYCQDCGVELSRTPMVIEKAAHKASTETVKATAKKDGKIVKKCSVCGEVISETKITKINSIFLDCYLYDYDGKAHQPKVTVKDAAGKLLSQGRDYTVTYSGNGKKLGIYTVTVKFTGNYEGTGYVTYTVVHPVVNKVVNTITKLLGSLFGRK